MRDSGKDKESGRTEVCEDLGCVWCDGVDDELFQSTLHIVADVVERDRTKGNDVLDWSGV